MVGFVSDAGRKLSAKYWDDAPSPRPVRYEFCGVRKRNGSFMWMNSGVPAKKSASASTASMRTKYLSLVPSSRRRWSSSASSADPFSIRIV